MMSSKVQPELSVDVEAGVPETPTVLGKGIRASGTMAAWDLDGDGRISLQEARLAARSMISARRREYYLLALILLLLGGMFFTSYSAINITAEMHIRDGHLVDNEGQAVSTRSQVGSIVGVHSASRRLNASSNGNETTSYLQQPDSAMQIPADFFHSTAASYASGQAEWVVRLPDDSVRTVHVMGTSGGTAWGSCGDCLGTVTWIARCEEGAVECSIDWTRRERRLAAAAADVQMEAALLARARRASSNDGAVAMAQEGAVERTLNAKCQA